MAKRKNRPTGKEDTLLTLDLSPEAKERRRFVFCQHLLKREGTAYHSTPPDSGSVANPSPYRAIHGGRRQRKP